MKRTVSVILCALMLFLMSNSSLATGFTQSADAIETAAQSVLMLYIYDSNDELIATGSAFCALNNMTLVTNYHVIEGCSKVVAASDTGIKYTPERVLCADKKIDIAIIGFNNPTNLMPLEIKPDNRLKRGSTVVAIGSPEGLRNTVSIGNISSQFEEDGIPWIQFTAPISHGSSGGALFNDEGQVIGVTSGAYESGQNLNFAINIAVVQAMYNAWDGNLYTFSNFKSTAKMDYTNVYSSVEKTGTLVPNAITESETWTCPDCGQKNTTQFCSECGLEKPSWVCVCGRINNGKFCGYCGRSETALIQELNNALALMDQHNYLEAIPILEGLGPFNCLSITSRKGKYISAPEQLQVAKHELDTQVQKSYYEKGLSLLEANSYDNAILYLQKANHYSNADEMILSAHYQLGKKHLDNRNYAEAIQEFTQAGNYTDAKEQITRVYYFMGLDCLEKKQYDEAINYFSQAKEYADAVAKIKEVNESKKASIYAEAERLYTAQEYDSAAEKFASINDYSDAAIRASQCYYKEGSLRLSEKDYDNASNAFSKAGNYLDAEYWVSETIFLKIKDYYEDTTISTSENKRTYVLNELEKIKEVNVHAAEYIIKINYQCGVDALNSNNYPVAIIYFASTIDYFDSKEKLYEAQEKQCQYYISRELYSAAYNLYLQRLDSDKPIEDFPILFPDNENAIITKLLDIAKSMEIIDSYNTSEKKYKQAYVNTIKKMEKNLDFTADGIITLSEYMILQGLIYPSVDSIRVKYLLEKLSDLGYISGLADSHSKYERKYINGIKNAEKEFGLKADGYITEKEYDIISKAVITLKPPSNVKTSVKNADVTITWTDTQVNVWYKIYRNGELIKTTKDKSYIDKNVISGKNYTYKIAACNYSSTSDYSSVRCYIDKYYKAVTIDQLVKNAMEYEGDYVSISKIPVVHCGDTSYKSSKEDGYAIICQKTINGKTYTVTLILKNYNGWNWEKGKGLKDQNLTSAGGKGKVEIITYEDFNDGIVPMILLDEISWEYK